jgi:nucleotide-binding universal stress UspA family protein
MLQRIMVALDGSSLAEQTLPYASALARAFGTEIILLRVVETPVGVSGRALDSFDWRMERTEAVSYLQRMKRRLNEEGISVDVDVTAGRACEEILEMAGARDVDLMVLATHGLGGLSEFHMASTAQKVVFAADTSVLVVPACETAAIADAPFQSVLVPVDCSCHSDWAVTLAAQLARSEGVDLVVLHVVQTPTLLDPQGTDRERQLIDELVTLNRGAAARYIESLAKRLESPDLTLRSRVEVADDLARAVERHATAETRPLLVLGTRGHARFDDAPRGTLVAAMLASTGHPVLVLREPRRTKRDSRRWSSSLEPPNRRRAPLSAG